MKPIRPALAAATLAIAGALTTTACTSLPDEVDRAQIDAGSRAALSKLINDNAAARAVNSQSRAALVFPSIVKGGLGFGGAYGEGELIQNGRTVDYYNSFTGSWGLQAGAQSYGYVVFLMNDKAVNYLSESDGWEIGVGPNVVLVNAGVAQNLSTSTLKEDAYAFIFDQKGLMAGVSIEGTKITKMND